MDAQSMNVRLLMIKIRQSIRSIKDYSQIEDIGKSEK